MNARLTPLLVALLLFAAGCVAPGEATYDGPRTTVEVVNNSFYDNTIYIVRTGQRYRLGEVRGTATRTFDLPRTVAAGGGPVVFVADPRRLGRNPYSREIYIVEGERARFVIPAI